MRVCIISRSINKRGGIARYNAELAERFCRDHEVHLLVSRCEIKNPNLTMHPYSIVQKPYSLQLITSFVKVSIIAKKLDERYNFDVIHTSEAESLYQDVITAHSCIKGAFEKLTWNNRFYDFLRRIRPFVFFGLTAEKLIYSHHKYKKIIAVSTGVKREIMNYYNVPEEDIIVIPNGVDIEEFKPNRNIRKSVRERYGIKENDVVLMFSGYEFKRKGLKYIIGALPRIKKDVKLLVVGKDNPRSYQQLATKLGVHDKIIFTDFVPEIAGYYAASDIFVFPTLYEPFGLVVAEALASGLPVIVSEGAGATEVINDGREGLLLKDPTNLNEVAEKINILVKDENLRKQMSRNARKTAEKYSWDEVARRTMEVYASVVKK